jgi:hypothetical protein
MRMNHDEPWNLGALFRPLNKVPLQGLSQGATNIATRIIKKLFLKKLKGTCGT